MSLKDALAYFGVSGFVSKAALGRGSSLLPSTILVFSLLVVAFALVALLGARDTVGTFAAAVLVALLGAGGSVGAFVLTVWHAWCLRVDCVFGCWRHRCFSFGLRC